MNTKEIKAITKNVINKLKKDNPSVKVFMCEHVETGEQPASVNIYAGRNKRIFLCSICVRVAETTINDWSFIEKWWGMRVPGIILGRLQGTVFAMEIASRIIKPFSKK